MTPFKNSYFLYEEGKMTIKNMEVERAKYVHTHRRAHAHTHMLGQGGNFV